MPPIRIVGGHDPKAPDPGTATLEPQAERNFTDSQSRIVPGGSQKGAVVEGDYAQIAVAGAAQIIVAVDALQQATDNHPLAPMLEQTERGASAARDRETS
jgi:hypothetical protein